MFLTLHLGKGHNQPADRHFHLTVSAKASLFSGVDSYNGSTLYITVYYPPPQAQFAPLILSCRHSDGEMRMLLTKLW